VRADRNELGGLLSRKRICGARNHAKFFGLHDRKNPPNALLNPYPTSDDRWILLVVAQQDRDWPDLVNVIGHPELLNDERFSDVKKRSVNAGALAGILDNAFASKPLADWKEAFAKTRITVGVVQTLEEVVSDEQMLANNILVPVHGAGQGARTVNSPMQVIGSGRAHSSLLHSAVRRGWQDCAPGRLLAKARSPSTSCIAR
jgi:formyl-CoA transferase